MKTTVTCLAAAVALAACGGGGSGGGGVTTAAAPSFANPTPIAPGGVIPSDGTAFSTSGTAIQAVLISNSTISTLSTPVPAELVASTSSTGGTPDAIRFTVRGKTVEIDLLNAVAIGGGASADTIFIQIPEGQLDLDYAIFGGWGETSGPGGLPAAGDTVNLGAFGNPTPVAQLPTADATYTGRSIGLAQGAGPAGITNSNVGITVQNGFTDVTFNSTGTMIDALDNLGNPMPAPSLDFTSTGTVTGNGYAATGQGMRVEGAFYGNAGQETAGTFIGARTGTTYGGAFGAKQ